MTENQTPTLYCFCSFVACWHNVYFFYGWNKVFLTQAAGAYPYCFLENITVARKSKGKHSSLLCSNWRRKKVLYHWPKHEKISILNDIKSLRYGSVDNNSWKKWISTKRKINLKLFLCLVSLFEIKCKLLACWDFQILNINWLKLEIF